MLEVRVATDSAAALAHTGAWQALAHDALEPNPFYEPWMLLPALEAYARRVHLVFLYEGSSLAAFFPLERAYFYRRLPIPHMRLWRYPHCYLGTPLVRTGYGVQALETLFDWLGNDMVHWRDLPGDGPFVAALQAVGGAVRYCPYRRNRALLRRHGDADAYIAQALHKATRKELARLQRRLAELGVLAFKRSDDTESFLALEAAGWKGRNGSALASTPQGRRFFRAMSAQAARLGRLELLSLELNGRPIAMKCNLLAGEGAFAFKIAYDEAFARYSPGTLLELENIRAFHCGGARWMDSCAAPEHFMANRLWLERRALVDVVGATGKAPANFALSSLSMLHRLWRSMRGAAPVPAAP
jgi:CelD/BcsL family acetyltransferase involved in cellulose biosynthesis